MSAGAVGYAARDVSPCKGDGCFLCSRGIEKNGLGMHEVTQQKLGSAQ